jgi:hypothetical protein
MASDEALRRHADELARLLPDARGAEILAALQRLRTHQARPQALLVAAAPPPAIGGGPDEGRDVGIWRTERAAGGIALRRRDVEANPWHWARADYIPTAAGAQRVIVMGESVARGWGYDPVLNPAMPLDRQLNKAAPGQYQCVGGLVDLIYRGKAATGPDATVAVNGNLVGTLPPAASRTPARLEIPAAALRPGVNWLSIDWPIPDIDAERALAADCSAMARGEFTFMLPVFGELFDARITLGQHPGRFR